MISPPAEYFITCYTVPTKPQIFMQGKTGDRKSSSKGVEDRREGGQRKPFSPSPSPHRLTWWSQGCDAYTTAMILWIGAICSVYLHDTCISSGNSQDRARTCEKSYKSNNTTESRRTEGDIKQMKCVKKALVN